MGRSGGSLTWRVRCCNVPVPGVLGARRGSWVWLGMGRSVPFPGPPVSVPGLAGRGRPGVWLVAVWQRVWTGSGCGWLGVE